MEQEKGIGLWGIEFSTLNLTHISTPDGIVSNTCVVIWKKKKENIGGAHIGHTSVGQFVLLQYDILHYEGLLINVRPRALGYIIWSKG
jgi:hypothetical protein